MKKMKITVLITLFLIIVDSNKIQSQENKVFLITLDGLRWQELFRGAEWELLQDKNYTQDIERLKNKFWKESDEERRKALFPFIWDKVEKQGVIIGNRDKNSRVNVKNGMHFSYPGYNEIITGKPDDTRINNNNKVGNPNVSLFEFANQDPMFKGKIAIFGGWDVFPFIFNEERSKLPVNAGYRHSLSSNPSFLEKFLDKFQDETPKRWQGVRFDVFTHNYALETIKKEKPRLVFIGYGETDDFAHDGSYNHYLESAHVNDQMIRELWEYVQSDSYYKDQTTFIITTDHGRGTGDHWKDHYFAIPGSSETWLILIGNQVHPPLFDKEQYYNDQIAATIAKILQIDYKPKDVGSALY
ncbi:alkaline phosphatase family protein [Apibacter raozihei]|uniref:alkaline phosphatase family protein n=1 Tax=Apibacter raozihei TaxID=2500547 RepID=UPI001E282D25|nr:alkaline phosphatase family protein [Apibacter raozihei]